MRLLGITTAAAVLLAATAASAQQSPPAKNDVAPEYRDLAEQRAKEKRAIAFCQRKADEARVLVRDRTKFVIDCLDHKPPVDEPPKLTIEHKKSI